MGIPARSTSWADSSSAGSIRSATSSLIFTALKEKLAIELDGGQHDLDAQMAYDSERTCLLEKEGIRVLRYWDIDLLQNLDGILEDILIELENRVGLPEK